MEKERFLKGSIRKNRKIERQNEKSEVHRLKRKER